MEDLSFADVPDEEKIRIIIESNQRLREGLRLGKENSQLLKDRIAYLEKRLSDLNNQEAKIQSLQSKVDHYFKNFLQNPKKLFPNLHPTVIIYLNQRGLYQDFVIWYKKNHNKNSQHGDQ